MGQAFSKLMAQHNENEMVLKELKFLDDSSKVYKLVGPVLLSQVGAVRSRHAAWAGAESPGDGPICCAHSCVPPCDALTGAGTLRRTWTRPKPPSRNVYSTSATKCCFALPLPARALLRCPCPAERVAHRYTSRRLRPLSSCVADCAGAGPGRLLLLHPSPAGNAHKTT